MDNFSNMKCALFQVRNLTSLPYQFLELLKLENPKIIEISIGSDLAKIGRDFRCNDIVKTLKNITNLDSFARKRNAVSSGVVKLKTLVKIVLEEDLQKDNNIGLSN